MSHTAVAYGETTHDDGGSDRHTLIVGRWRGVKYKTRSAGRLAIIVAQFSVLHSRLDSSFIIHRQSWLASQACRPAGPALRSQAETATDTFNAQTWCQTAVSATLRPVFIERHLRDIHGSSLPTLLSRLNSGSIKQESLDM